MSTNPGEIQDGRLHGGFLDFRVRQHPVDIRAVFHRDEMDVGDATTAFSLIYGDPRLVLGGFGGGGIADATEVEHFSG
ncbi:hypothetical protein H0264_22105 [Nocardia huaxiensis]|uniref:Uncharacterized protein n=1 Tax=Nocardia huaxiensis TaxID=2755382 RepID=A0A7D6V772_9NOCA|nr:hypothetical protein [Nocardia huaxiensis]QLY28091.1 hypothetical protein H0264_22105 [Nocardia huaxiensis]